MSHAEKSITPTRVPKPSMAESALQRITDGVWRSQNGLGKHNGDDIPSRFGYDHGNMLVIAKSGKKDLLFEHNGDSLRSNACRALYELSPERVKELVRGYRIAAAAGLLGDGKPPCEEVQGVLAEVMQAAKANGLMDHVYEAIRLKHRIAGLY